MFLSVRTVEWRLRKVFMKVGIASRKESKDALPAHGQSPSVTAWVGSVPRRRTAMGLSITWHKAGGRWRTGCVENVDLAVTTP
jgi:hypothetical protein